MFLNDVNSSNILLRFHKKLSITLILLLSFSLVAKKGEQKQSGGIKSDIVITSKTLKYDQLKNRAVFRGDVLVINGDIQLRADIMTCYFTKANKPTIIVAENNVIMTRGTQRVTSGKAVYKVKTEHIRLTQSPVIVDGDNKLKARAVDIYRLSQKTTFEEPEGTLLSTKKK